MKFIYFYLFTLLASFSTDAQAKIIKTEVLRMEFAYRNVAAPSAEDRFIFLQGEGSATSQIIRACNVTGANCVCDFYKSEELVHKTGPRETSFFQKGNNFRCEYSGTTPVDEISHVVLRSNERNFFSGKLPVQTSLSLSNLLGRRYSFNYVRHISEYKCEQNYLQKQGTSSMSFNCSSQAARCGEGSGDFCLLSSNLSYYLYGDQLSNNLGEKASDKLYNSGSSNSICGLQIFEYSCTGEIGLPQLQFGLYARPEGIWETAVQLSARPGGMAYGYGFAANPFADGTCPMGLVKKSLYTATSDLTRLHPSHNVPSNMRSFKMADSSVAPPAFSWIQIEGGDCNGNSCTRPTNYAGVVAQAEFFPQEREYCVLPANMLQ